MLASGNSFRSESHFRLSPKYRRFIQGRRSTITDSSRLHHTATVRQALGMTSVSWCPVRPCEPWLSILSARRVAQNVNDRFRHVCNVHRNMSAEVKKEIQLEIAHVLFIDIVGYSKLSINDQRAAIDELTQAVRTSEQFQNAEAAARLLKIPTGDGMALVFSKSPEEPVECALEISSALKDHPKIRLRMGVHSGPVSG